MLKSESTLISSKESGVCFLADLLESIGAGVKDAFCSVTDPIEQTLQLGDKLYQQVGAPGFPGASTPAAQGLRNQRNLFCGVEPEVVTPADVGLPFSGGQCPETYNVQYVASFEHTRPFFPSPHVLDTTGPAGNFHLGPLGPATVGERSFSMEASGSQAVGVVIGPEWGDVSGLTVQWVIEKQSGGPDDCGDPEPVPPPYDEDDLTVPVPITYDPPAGPPVSLTVPVVFAPVDVNNNLEVEVPIRANFDVDVDVTGVLNLSTGDINFNIGNEITVPTPVDDPSIEPSPQPPVSNPTEPLEPIAGVIIGVRVVITSISESSRASPIPTAAAGVEMRVPYMALVSFNCEDISVGAMSWTEDLPVKFTDQIIYCPIPWGARAVAVTAEPGIQLEASLIVAESERALLLRAANVE